MPDGAAQMEKMTEAQVTESLKAAPEWSQVGETIQRTYQFADFVTAMRFVNSVAQAAEKAQHHPDILIRYSRVTLTLATHDASGITEKDFSLAQKADAYFLRLVPPAAGAAPAEAGKKKQA